MILHCDSAYNSQKANINLRPTVLTLGIRSLRVRSPHSQVRVIFNSMRILIHFKGLHQVWDSNSSDDIGHYEEVVVAIGGHLYSRCSMFETMMSLYISQELIYHLRKLLKGPKHTRAGLQSLLPQIPPLFILPSAALTRLWNSSTGRAQLPPATSSTEETRVFFINSNSLKCLSNSQGFGT